jgi:hypothetical protein
MKKIIALSHVVFMPCYSGIEISYAFRKARHVPASSIVAWSKKRAKQVAVRTRSRGDPAALRSSRLHDSATTTLLAQKCVQSISVVLCGATEQCLAWSDGILETALRMCMLLLQKRARHQPTLRPRELAFFALSHREVNSQKVSRRVKEI